MDFKLQNLIPNDLSRAFDEEYIPEEDEEIIEKKEFEPLFIVQYYF
jgi:hypothetical protein